MLFKIGKLIRPKQQQQTNDLHCEKKDQTKKRGCAGYLASVMMTRRSKSSSNRTASNIEQYSEDNVSNCSSIELVRQHHGGAGGRQSRASSLMGHIVNNVAIVDNNKHHQQQQQVSSTCFSISSSSPSSILAPSCKL